MPLDEIEKAVLHDLFRRWYKDCKETGVYPCLLIGFCKDGSGEEMIIYKNINYKDEEVEAILSHCLLSIVRG